MLDLCANSVSTGQFHPATTSGSPGGPAPPLTWAFALPSQETFKDRAKSVPNLSAVKPLTSGFVIRASPTLGVDALADCPAGLVRTGGEVHGAAGTLGDCRTPSLR